VGLAVLVFGLVILLGAHLFTTMRERRAAVIARLGEGPYKALYSLVSLAGLTLIVIGFAHYRATGGIDIWYPPAWTRHVVVAAMWPGSILLIAAYARGNIYRVIKHPMLTAVKLWAAAHLIANGDLGGILLFGSFLAWAVLARISYKRRADLGGPPIPIGGMRNDVIAVVTGTMLYLVLGFYFHPYVIGVPAFSR
jgi:uncharacterized membrane protein